MTIPAEMMEAKRWTLYRLDGNGHHAKKLPYSVASILKNRDKPKPVNPFDSSGWASYTTVYDLLKTTRYPEKWGLGFVLGDGYCCLDIDEIPGKISTDNPEIDRALYFTNQTYTEVSQSGTGVHCFFKVDDEIPPHGTRGINKRYELYSSERFIAVTGNRLTGDQVAYLTSDDFCELIGAYSFYPKQQPRHPTQGVKDEPAIIPDEQVLKDMFGSANGAIAYKLFKHGIHPNHPEYSHSELDLSLCNFLAFYSYKNHGQIDRLFRQSALYRDKWDERRAQTTYGEMTIQAGISSANDRPKPSN